MKGLPKVREGANVDEVLEEVVAARRAGTDPKEMFGGPRDWIDAGLPTVFFLGGRAFGGLRTGIVAALVAVGVVVLIRLVRRETLRHAFSGVVGVVISVQLARTFGAKGFFLKDIIVNAVYGVAFLLSVVFRHPLVGVIMRLVLERPKEWHDHPKVRRAYAEASIGWALMFLARFTVQVTLYRLDQVGALGAVKLAMGYPLFVGLLALTMPYVRWRTRDVPISEDDEPEDAESEAAAAGSAGEGEAEGGGEDAGDDAPERVGGRGGA